MAKLSKDPAKQPPGYDPTKPIFAYKADGKLICPIPGCKHKGASNQDRFSKHLKTDHHRCLDPAKIRVYSQNLIYDKQCKVLVCLEHETIRFKNTHFCEDPGYSITGVRTNTFEDELACVKVENLATELPEGQPVMGLPIFSGYHCDVCGVVEKNEHQCTGNLIECRYQRIKDFKNSHAVLHRIGDSPEHMFTEISQDDPPVHEERQYLRRHEFLWRDFDFEDHANIMRNISNDEARVCQAIFELYFYEHYVTLVSDRYVGFRRTLSHDLNECEPFGTLSDKTAVIRYAVLFGKFGVLLLRNRIFHENYGTSPLGQKAANLMFYIRKKINENVLYYRKIVSQLKTIKERLPIVKSNINEYDRRFASNAVDLTNLTVLDKEDILI